MYLYCGLIKIITMAKTQIHASISTDTERKIIAAQNIQETETSFSQMTEALIKLGLKATGYTFTESAKGAYKVTAVKKPRG